MKLANSEGYRDPTAAIAIRNTQHHQTAGDWDRERERISDLIHAIRAVAAVGGFEIVGRVVVKDKKTGKVYR